MSSEIFSGTLFAPGYWASGGIDDLGQYVGGSAGTTTATLTGTLAKVGDLATAVIVGQALTLRAYSDLANGVLFTTPDFATFYAFFSLPFAAGQSYVIGYTVAGQSELACFAAGTRIATPRGEVPVERLRPGLRVRTPDGEAVVRWVGRQRLCPTGPRVWPVRIAAHAFAPGRPRRHLLLSPDHGVFAGGGLIPARDLLNGATVTRRPMERVEYWHVELAEHGLLLAEGLAVESFRDAGNRRLLAGRGRPVGARRGCAPLLLTRAGQAPVRAALLARAAAIGHGVTTDPGLTVRAGALTVPVAREGRLWRAALPPGVDRVRLCSRSAVPAERIPGSDDPRRLGVAVTWLKLDGATIGPDDPRRAAGWHRPEPGWQWTDGDALLLLGGAGQGPRRLEIATLPLLSYWRDASRDLRARAHRPAIMHHARVRLLDAAGAVGAD